MFTLIPLRASGLIFNFYLRTSCSEISLIARWTLTIWQAPEPELQFSGKCMLCRHLGVFVSATPL